VRAGRAGEGERALDLRGVAVELVGGWGLLVDVCACVQWPQHWHALFSRDDPVTVQKVSQLLIAESCHDRVDARFECGQQVVGNGGAGGHKSSELFDLGQRSAGGKWKGVLG
jgi:hypothetical protein